MDEQAYQATPSAILERRIMDPSIPKNEQEHWAANEIHRLRDILGGGCPMHPYVSLLDRIHAVRDAADTYGQPDLARWLAKHADEPCPAAIKQAMGIGAGEPRKCVQTVNRFGYPLNAPCQGDKRLHSTPESECGSREHGCLHHEPLYAAPSDPPAPDASTDAVREAVALDAKHGSCSDPAADCSIAKGPRFHYKRIAVVDECRNVRLRRPLLAVLSDAEKRAKDAEDRLGYYEKLDYALRSISGAATTYGTREVHLLDCSRADAPAAEDLGCAQCNGTPEDHCTHMPTCARLVHSHLFAERERPPQPSTILPPGHIAEPDDSFPVSRAGGAKSDAQPAQCEGCDRIAESVVSRYCCEVCVVDDGDMHTAACDKRTSAPLLDRGDALERAAVNALRSFDEFTIERTGGAFVYQVIGGPMEDLRFVLQRAKEPA